MLDTRLLPDTKAARTSERLVACRACHARAQTVATPDHLAVDHGRKFAIASGWSATLDCSLDSLRER